MNTILVLDLEVLLMRMAELLGLQSVDIVHIEIERHVGPPRQRVLSEV
jgi:hypothetical protein